MLTIPLPSMATEPETTSPGVYTRDDDVGLSTGSSRIAKRLIPMAAGEQMSKMTQFGKNNKKRFFLFSRFLTLPFFVADGRGAQRILVSGMISSILPPVVLFVCFQSSFQGRGSWQLSEILKVRDRGRIS